MIKIPKEFSARYSEFIKDQGVEPRLQSYYLKWLRYYLDFYTNYSFKWSEKNSLPAFLIKLKSKNQKPLMLEQEKNAVHLLAFFFLDKPFPSSTRQPRGLNYTIQETISLVSITERLCDDLMAISNRH